MAGETQGSDEQRLSLTMTTQVRQELDILATEYGEDIGMFVRRAVATRMFMLRVFREVGGSASFVCTNPETDQTSTVEFLGEALEVFITTGEGPDDENPA